MDLATAFDRFSLMRYKPINIMPIQTKYSENDEND